LFLFLTASLFPTPFFSCSPPDSAHLDDHLSSAVSPLQMDKKEKTTTKRLKKMLQNVHSSVQTIKSREKPTKYSKKNSLKKPQRCTTHSLGGERISFQRPKIRGIVWFPIFLDSLQGFLTSFLLFSLAVELSEQDTRAPHPPPTFVFFFNNTRIPRFVFCFVSPPLCFICE